MSRATDSAGRALLAVGGLVRRAEVSADGRTLHQIGGRRGRRLLPGPLEPRQGGPLHARGELHRLLLLEGVRQGRDHHLGDAADRLPVGRARTARSTSRAAARAARPSPGTPTRPPGCATRTCAACCWRCTARPRPGCGDPVLAWADIVGDPERRRRYQQARGKGGLVRVALGRGDRDRRRRARAHHQDATARTGCAGFSPIPAMSMVSHAVGARFMSADRRRRCCRSTTGTPTCRWPRPQVFGDQTDVPGVRRLVGRRAT